MNDLGVTVDEFVEAHRLNARLAWAWVAAAAALALWRAVEGDARGALVTAGVLVLVAAPGPFHRTLWVTLPWEVVAATTLVVGYNAVSPSTATLYATVAVAALVATLDLHLFTRARISHRVAGGLVVVGTAAAAGAWVALRWAGSVVPGVPALPGQSAIMAELLVAAAVGLLVGLAFEAYVLGWEARLDRFTPLLAGER